MGLPARQRRVLESIESRLRASDPKLAAMFVIFGRLCRDEQMPRIEELRHRLAMLALRARFRLAAIASPLRMLRRHPADPLGGRRPRRPAANRAALARRNRWRPMAVFFPIALVMMSLSIFVAARFGSAPRCVAQTAAVATSKLHPKVKPPAKANPLTKIGTRNAGKPGSKSASRTATRRCRANMLTPVPSGR